MKLVSETPVHIYTTDKAVMGCMAELTTDRELLQLAKTETRDLLQWAVGLQEQRCMLLMRKTEVLAYLIQLASTLPWVCAVAEGKESAIAFS